MKKSLTAKRLGLRKFRVRAKKLKNRGKMNVDWFVKNGTIVFTGEKK